MNKHGRKLGHEVTQETREKIRQSLNGRKNKPHSQETRDKMSRTKKGRPIPSLLGHLVSEETRKKISERLKGNRNGAGHKHSEEMRRKMSEIAKARGAQHNFFVDGKGYERATERQAPESKLEYRLWREAVFSRDDYTCQECGVRGGELNAHHIQRWKEHPEKRFDVRNGQTLCLPCHKKTPDYAKR